MNNKIYTYLNNINSPEDLKKIKKEELKTVSDELRQYIIDEVSKNPGHLGSNLGVVELTVALHYVFNTPYDRIVWDVGHQAYGHKILTGRRDTFHTNRQFGGISGFPKISESEYDAFGVGHASTSISAALGMSVAALMKGEDRQVVAVIGDGAMTGGLAFEGLNNTSMDKNNLLIILNDNQMAIDPIIGGFTQYLVDITTSPLYNKVRYKIYNFFKKRNWVDEEKKNQIIRVNNSIKTFFTRQKQNIFESLNIRYFGPVDGHDVENLVRILSEIKKYKGPKVLHCITKKGKGYEPAEKSVTLWHAPGKFDVETGERIVCNHNNVEPQLFQDVFGKTLLELAKHNEKIVGITPAMPSGCSMTIMQRRYPERVFDVGIAEGHAVTFSAGLAKEGMVPFCNIYSSFMQRAYDNVIHDVALQRLPVIICLDRAGIVGADGATHQGQFDLAYMRCIPNLTIAAPRDEIELRNLMYTAQLPEKGAFVIRYPRGKGFIVEWHKEWQELPIGKGECLKDGNDIAVITIGTMANAAKKAIEMVEQESGVSIAHYDARFLKPLDEELIHEIAGKFKNIITIEDGVIKGGFGSAVLEFLEDNNYHLDVLRLGIPDKFIDHGTPDELYAMLKLDDSGIKQSILSFLKNASLLRQEVIEKVEN
ncbi:MAG: 1-deoxy-D-xylulose-5-phosphate synthase [Paludibacteraceae bacterium]